MLPGVGTVGLMTVHPNSRNVIPGKVFFTVDLRHPYDEELEKMKAALDAGAAKICGNLDVEYDLQEIWNSPAIHYDPACIDAVRKAADEAGLPNRDIVSGAGHDAGYIARVAPVGMIFVPCAEGISHNEIESALPEDLAAGCNVLMRAMVELAA